MARHFSRPALSKAGQIEIPFHWIFALVGGFLFLLFFFVLIRSVVTSNQQRDTADLTLSVQTILLNALTKPGEFTVSDLQSASYRFVCERDAAGMLSYVRIGQGSYDPSQLRYVPFFSPSVVEGDQLFTRTAVWKAPFPVSPVLLVSNNRTRYVFVGSAGSLPSIRSFIQGEGLDGFNTFVASSSAMGAVKDEGLDQYRFVFFGGFADPGQAFKNATALNVQLSADGTSGTLTFYDDLSCAGSCGVAPRAQLTVPFVGTAMLDAAIFSQDSSAFRCGFAKMEERLNTSVTTLLGRLDDLSSPSTNVPQQCKALYGQARQPLQDYETDPLGAFSSVGGNPSAAQQIQTIQRRLAAEGVCPGVY